MPYWLSVFLKWTHKCLNPCIRTMSWNDFCRRMFLDIFMEIFLLIFLQLLLCPLFLRIFLRIFLGLLLGIFWGLFLVMFLGFFWEYFWEHFWGYSGIFLGIFLGYFGGYFWGYFSGVLWKNFVEIFWWCFRNISRNMSFEFCGERAIFQTFWKVHCCAKFLFFELETSKIGYLLIF